MLQTFTYNSGYLNTTNTTIIKNKISLFDALHVCYVEYLTSVASKDNSVVFTSDVCTRLKDLTAVVLSEETSGKLLSVCDDGETSQRLLFLAVCQSVVNTLVLK